MKPSIFSTILCLSLLRMVSNAADIGGVGIVVGNDGDAIIVRAIVPDSPAAKSGALKPKDRIVAVAEGNGVPVKISGQGIAQSVRMLRGPVGSTVRLTIIPSGAEASQSRVITLVRAEQQFTRALRAAEHVKVGMPAPEITGADVDGKTFKLSDYRGKVVLVDLWGDW
ncbi:MAG: PDZ domain-containing protein [Verrucomicrobia bacterium]|nr:PDZ domain-containing protein [Verrucomicrobiota bacterium]